MKKEHFLANNTNKQELINMLGNQLEQNKCTVHHAPGDADLLIVQKAVESAVTVDTVLVGDDTDLLILLCYHVSLDSHSMYFRPEPKKSTKNPRVWNIKAVKEQLGPEVSSFCMLSSDVIQPPVFLALERELLSRNLNQVDTFASKPRYSMSRHPRKILLLQESKCWSAFTMGNPEKYWIPCAISGSARRWRPIQPKSNLRLCHLLQLQLSTTVSVYISRYNSGRVMNFNRKSGDGECVKED